jgi:uncharacterized RDD family membrane protein YckC
VNDYAFPPPAEALANAGVGRRIGGAVLDLLILLVVFVVVGIFLGDATAGGGSVNVSLGGVGTLVFLVLMLLYFYLTESSMGRSPGKAAVGLRVVGEDGSPPTNKAILIRTLMRLIDWLPMLYLVGFITMLATGADRQRVGDLVAKTRVVRAN